MVKRKAGATNNSTGANGAESSDEDTASLLDVDFEWFDPVEIDFHGLKLLLRQLFDVDSELFDLSALAELIISHGAVGSTVKVPEDEVETQETDPFAFLTVLSTTELADNQALRTLTNYLSTKSSSVPSLSTILRPLLDPSPSSATNVGLILNERLINMPAEITPPMYKMLVSEIASAVEDKQPYDFTHYLIISKAYTEIASQLAAMDLDDDNDDTARPQKKKSKKTKGTATMAAANETFYFHPEDEIWQRFAIGYGNFEYSKPWAEGAGDAKRAFQEAGIRPMGHMILIEASKFQEAVGAVELAINGAIS